MIRSNIILKNSQIYIKNKTDFLYFKNRKSKKKKTKLQLHIK